MLQFPLQCLEHISLPISPINATIKSASEYSANATYTVILKCLYELQLVFYEITPTKIPFPNLILISVWAGTLLTTNSNL